MIINAHICIYENVHCVYTKLEKILLTHAHFPRHIKLSLNCRDELRSHNVNLQATLIQHLHSHMSTALHSAEMKLLLCSARLTMNVKAKRFTIPLGGELCLYKAFSTNAMLNYGLHFLYNAIN